MDFFISGITEDYALKVVFNLLLSVVLGGLIGNERERHGRAAGMRTHMIVCLGASLTSMMSLYINEIHGATGDVFRISAQVVSGIGFLGAGMIILKNNSVITGLTTAAGIWTTGIIGLAVGYGFYIGAVGAALLCLSATVLLSKLERRKKLSAVFYIECDNMYETNALLDKVHDNLQKEFTYRIVPPKSGASDHIGIELALVKRDNSDLITLLQLDGVVFVAEE